MWLSPMPCLRRFRRHAVRIAAAYRTGTGQRRF
jgi:hypothetical protein